MVKETVTKYLRQSDFAEHIEFLNQYASEMKRAVFIWEDDDGTIRSCGIHTGLSFIEAFGLIELGKQALFDFMEEDTDDEDTNNET